MITCWKKYVNYDFQKPSIIDRNYIERLIGQKYPNEYWNLVEKYQGYIPDPDYFILKKTGREETFGVLLHVFEQSQLKKHISGIYSAIVRYGIFRGRYASEIIPFSDDTGGNQLAFDFRNKPNPSIVFVDHNLSGDDGLAFVANNFSELLDMLSPSIHLD
jgi:hypothetical protein